MSKHTHIYSVNAFEYKTYSLWLIVIQTYNILKHMIKHWKIHKQQSELMIHYKIHQKTTYSQSIVNLLKISILVYYI